MRTPSLLLVLLLASVCALLGNPAEAACDGTTIATGAATIDVNGLMRLFVVRRSSSLDARVPAPVVFVFHPYGMNAQYMESRVSTRLWPAAIMVYPEGASGPGRGYAPAWQNRAGESGDRDLQFFDAMLAWLGEHHCIDRTRVFVFGYSNGAGLAGLLACQRAGAVAGVAMASGRLSCTPPMSKPVAITHGLGDSTIPYEESIRAALAWTKLNACRTPPRFQTPGCATAVGCGATTPVLMCTSPGGHEYSSAFTRPALELFQRVKGG